VRSRLPSNLNRRAWQAWRGHRQAVVISTAEYERLLKADEDVEDLAASDAVMAEITAGAPTIPWAQVKADLGLA